MFTSLPADLASPDILAALLAVAPTGVAVLRPVYAASELADWTCVHLNPTAQRLFGLPERPAVTLRTWLAASTAAGLLGFLCDTFNARLPSHFDAYYRTQNRNYHLGLAAQRAGDLLVVSINDPSRSLVEDALRQSQAREQAARAAAEATAQRLLLVTESLPSTTFIVDQHGRSVYTSPQWYAYTGLAPDALVEEAWPTLLHPDDRAATTQERYAALAEGRGWRYEFRMRGADGHYRWFASQGTPEPLAAAQAAGRSRQWFGSNLDIDALKQTQLQLQQQEQLLTNILSTVPAGVVTLEGEDLRYSFFNDAFQHRVQGRAMLGRTLTEQFPEAQEQGFPYLLRQVLRTGEPYHAPEAQTHLHDPRTGARQENYLDLTYLPLRHGQQPPHAVLGFSVDVTERVRARQQAEAARAALLAAAGQAAAQREAFYQVFEQTPACIALLRGTSHRFDYVNPAYQQLFPARQLRGLPLGEAMPEALEQGFLALLDKVYQTGETYYGLEVKFTATPADGQAPQDAYFDFTYQAIREGGTIVGVSSFAFEVTERVLARAQREAQQRQLTQVFEQAPVAICVFWGPEYVLDLVNPPMGEILGLAPAQALGRPFFETLPELTGQGIYELLEAVRTTGQPYAEQERPVQLARHAPGAPGYFNFVCEPLYDEQGQRTGIACVATDVSEQVRARQLVGAANEELRAANRQLTRTNADLDTFIYTASHDLRTPISNIEGLVLALREDLDLPAGQADIPSLLDLMQHDVERFKRTIAHLTDLSKLQHAHQSGPTAEVALAPLVAAVAADLRPQLEAAAGQLTVDVAACPSVAFSEKNLRSVVYNLLSNALKYRHSGRPARVALRSYPADGYRVLEVQDNGLGFDLGQRDKVFGLFRRLHDHVEGSGVGLYVVQKIMDNVGGRIEVDSEVGVGSTFRVYFPASIV
jgi:PAS domain S-box-containing protein